MIRGAANQPDLSALPEPVRAFIQDLIARLDAALNKVDGLTAENQSLRQKVEALIKRYFGGTKNESMDPNQLMLLLAGLEAMQPVAATPSAPVKDTSAARRDRKPARSGIPENLPVERVVIVPEEVKANPGQFRQIDEVITKELDYQPGRFLMRHYVRPKFVRKENTEVAQSVNSAATTAPSAPAPQAADCATVDNVPDPVAAQPAGPREVFIAPAPARLIEKGMPGAGLLIYLLLSRFEDHLPFYRLEKIFWERYGVPITRQSMVDWIEQLCFWFAPIYEEIKRELMRGNYLQVDETVIRYLDREEPGKSCQGYFWVYSRPGADVIFDWQTTRSHLAPLAVLKDFEGKLQTDGYEGYDALAKARARARPDKTSGLLHFDCWAHARRKFIDAKDDDKRALWFLRQIGLLYEVEKRARQLKVGPALRQAMRAAQSKMVLERIGKALKPIQSKVLPESKLGQAIRYTLNQWNGLIRYIDHGDVEADNNLVENSIRPTAIAKKNFLFIGHPDAGGRSAMIYSILGSCRRRAINPAQYLDDILKRLPEMKRSEIASVTPGAWAKAHPEARLTPAK
jgi:transposase